MLQQQQQPTDHADIASMPFCIPIRIGPSTSQKGSRTADATTRYDKLARNFLAAATLVGALYWIKL